MISINTLLTEINNRIAIEQQYLDTAALHLRHLEIQIDLCKTHHELERLRALDDAWMQTFLTQQESKAKLETLKKIKELITNDEPKNS